MSDKLVQYIITTVVYYDVMDYPMTAFEIWKYLIRNGKEDAVAKGWSAKEDDFSLAQVIFLLETEEKIRRQVDSKQGYYFLRGRTDLLEKRLERNKLSEKKLKIVLAVARWLRFVPYVRMVAVAGRLATKNAEKGSDLDLLIAVKHGKIFTGRLLVTLLVHLLGKRRYGKKIANRICLNHFVTTKFSIAARDLFSSHEYVFLKPVFDKGFFMRFQKHNDWIREYRPNFTASVDNIMMLQDSRISKMIRRVGEKILSLAWLEKKLGEWQRNKISNNPQSRKVGGLILCSDEELAFWPNFEKQGPAVFEKFQEKLRTMIK
ncbi:MAG: hypothetical protein WC823_06015 [Parcubacteria group bacterium]|jgi:hypothetical protein